MKAGFLILLVFAAYIGMEAFAVHKVGYRLEATWSLDQYAAEAEAVARCGSPEPERLARFHRNLDVVVRRAMKELGEAEGAPDADTIEAELAARQAARTAEVAAIVDEAGCGDARIVTHLKRFDIHARLNAGGPAKPG